MDVSDDHADISADHGRKTAAQRMICELGNTVFAAKADRTARRLGGFVIDVGSGVRQRQERVPERVVGVCTSPVDEGIDRAFHRRKVATMSMQHDHSELGELPSGIGVVPAVAPQ